MQIFLEKQEVNQEIVNELSKLNCQFEAYVKTEEKSIKFMEKYHDYDDACNTALFTWYNLDYFTQNHLLYE